jgi:hypothetical protein
VTTATFPDKSIHVTSCLQTWGKLATCVKVLPNISDPSTLGL